VVLLLFDGQALWFHSINSDRLVLALYAHVEAMLAWQPRPAGQTVDDSPLESLERSS
jgi:hypothetical protein